MLRGRHMSGTLLGLCLTLTLLRGLVLHQQRLRSICRGIARAARPMPNIDCPTHFAYSTGPFRGERKGPYMESRSIWVGSGQGQCRMPSASYCPGGGIGKRRGVGGWGGSLSGFAWRSSGGRPRALPRARSEMGARGLDLEESWHCAGASLVLHSYFTAATLALHP